MTLPLNGENVSTAAQLASLNSARPVAPFQTAGFRAAIAGPEKPEPPFPISLVGRVQKGFGRGGKELANLPDESITTLGSKAKTGVYYGYAQVVPLGDTALGVNDTKVLPMVMSLGWNPYYKNERLTAEIHIMHDFQADFYGYEMRALVLGYIRPEFDYTSREALKEDIEFDKRVALDSLDRPGYQIHALDSHFIREVN
ncbi:hypothetical protein AX17_000923 [Amanita inopinata Kibby_2008]|nr:hypothetical protein AX17_000923 [Amanita inopinata Kibby_2008]